MTVIYILTILFLGRSILTDLPVLSAHPFTSIKVHGRKKNLMVKLGKG